MSFSLGSLGLKDAVRLGCSGWKEGGKISRLHSVDGTRGYEGKKEEEGLLNPLSLFSVVSGFDFPVQSKFWPRSSLLFEQQEAASVS